jgi:hypothetical protein
MSGSSLVALPELKNQRNQTMLFVFGGSLLGVSGSIWPTCPVILRLDVGLLAQYVMNGLTLGMMYVLAAVGFTLFSGSPISSRGLSRRRDLDRHRIALFKASASSTRAPTDQRIAKRRKIGTFN